MALEWAHFFKITSFHLDGFRWYSVRLVWGDQAFSVWQEADFELVRAHQIPVFGADLSGIDHVMIWHELFSVLIILMVLLVQIRLIASWAT